MKSSTRGAPEGLDPKRYLAGIQAEGWPNPRVGLRVPARILAFLSSNLLLELAAGRVSCGELGTLLNRPSSPSALQM